MNEMPIKNGKIEGITKAYYEDGNLLSEMPRKNGKSEGMAKRYYPNGNLAIEIPYTNDKINGIIKVYNEGKKLIWQANAQNGKLVSGKCSSGKAFTSAHLTRLTNEINEGKWGRYWYDICEK
nr:toxin-antitoxin system YwqK family antitoxin [Helicobacter bilis]